MGISKIRYKYFEEPNFLEKFSRYHKSIVQIEQQKDLLSFSLIYDNSIYYNEFSEKYKIRGYYREFDLTNARALFIPYEDLSNISKRHTSNQFMNNNEYIM